MLENPIFWIVIVVVLYVLISPDPFASAIRAKIPFLQRKAADAVDRVDSRVEAAKAAQRGTVLKGRKGLYAIQQQLAEIDVELARVTDEIADDKAALAKAHQNEDREAFESLVQELNRDTAQQNVLIDTRAQVVKSLKDLEVAVDEQRAKERMIEDQGRVMVSKARVNDIMAEINETRAGLNSNGAEAQMEAAQKVLDKTTARANASQAAAEGLTSDERAKKKADAYIQQVKSGGDKGVKAGDLWNQMSESSKPTA